jgi:hypothetical protein
MVGRQQQMAQWPIARAMKEAFTRRNWTSILLGLLIFFGFLIAIIDLLSHPDLYQRDFQTYYYAGKAIAEDLNPYDLDVLSRLASTPLVHKFVYPPITLPLFKFLPLIEYTTAYYLYLVIKGIALIGLFVLWKNSFLPRAGLTFLLFCLIAYNSAIYIDFRVGNISIFEQILLWTSFLFLIREQTLKSALLILVVSCFKITPILFLSLLLLSKDKRRHFYIIGVFVVFLIIHGVSCLVTQSLFSSFIASLSGMDERGVINPSSFAFILDVLGFVEANFGIRMSNLLQFSVFSVIVAIILFISIKIFVMFRFNEKPALKKVGIFFACLVYALIIPRFKAYSYILLLVPTYFILYRFYKDREDIQSLGPVAISSPLILMTAFSSLFLLTLGSDFVGNTVLSYSSLFVAAIVWVLYVEYIRRWCVKVPGRFYEERK